MLTDTARRPSAGARFVLWGVAGSLGFFSLLRLAWTEAHVVLPFTRGQGWLAVTLFGAATRPVEVTLACSGADALALCLGAVLAYPVTWRARLAGAGGGVLLVLGLNTLRIGTLGRAAASPASFDTLHVYVWPSVLVLAITGYVVGWMRYVDRRGSPLGAPSGPTRRFVLLAAAFLLLFVATAPIYLQSPFVFWLGGNVAHAGAAALGVLGVSAYASANILWTPRGGVLVTQECISTPLIPIYLAAVCSRSTTWPHLVVGVLAALPLFMILGVVRLLVVVLPGAEAVPLFFVHAFYQLLLGAVVVCVAARWRQRTWAATLACAFAGIIVGGLFAVLAGPAYSHLVMHSVRSALADPQGAIALLPAFQVGLYLALWTAAWIPVGGRLLAGLALLALTQTGGLLALHALATHANVTPHVRDVRAWAVAGPVLIFAAVIRHARARR